MYMPRKFFGLVAVLFCLLQLAVAAEFSPILEAELAKAGANDFVSALVILENPLDIQALDAQLHAEQAPMARRHQEVLAALHYNADLTQPRFRAELDAAVSLGKVKGYTAYWIENLFVIEATRSFIESLRDRGDIRALTENFRAELIEPVFVGEPAFPDRRDGSLDEVVTPGLTAIDAVRVNRELGITGLGTLIGGLDTGVDGTHPALQTRWRGYGGAEPWQECWRDALSGGTTVPTDGHGHGTHTMGTMTGRTIIGNDTNTVGVAPRAKWIADNAINQGVGGGFDNDIIDAFQWFADPDGNPLTLDDVPDVVQNSWGVNTSLGYATCFTLWNTVVTNCEAAGVVVTWSAGNEGPSASTLRSPAIFSINETQIFSVGALNSTDFGAPYPIASFSSRGPTQCTPYAPNNIKPEISAPGVNVWSAYPGGGYTNMSGTSMAGPHVAGVVALMREACPDCDPTTIKMAIINTAVRTGYVTPPATENNTYGNGLINAYDAVLAVLGGMGRVMGTVRDSETLEPLQADVEVVGGSQTATASATGEYGLILRADSTYTLRYTYYGCVPQEVSVTVVESDTVFVDVNLVPRPVVTAFSDDFESGAPGWTHESGGGSWIDQWHLSVEQYETPTHAWKCGDTGPANYGSLNDARLISPVISNLPDDARLAFRYQIEAEISRTYGDSAYDGGVVELSVDGGPFNPITPVDGYTATFRYLSGGSNPATGPMLGWPCFSDTLPGWHDAAFDLAAYAGQSVQFRFRFGSDSGVNREGWYIDNVLVTGFGVGDLDTPISVVIWVEGEDVVLTWAADGNTAYRVYSDTNADGPFTTLVGETSVPTLTVPGAAALPRVFYVVRGYQP